MPLVATVPGALGWKQQVRLWRRSALQASTAIGWLFVFAVTCYFLDVRDAFPPCLVWIAIMTLVFGVHVVVIAYLRKALDLQQGCSFTRKSSGSGATPTEHIGEILDNQQVTNSRQSKETSDIGAEAPSSQACKLGNQITLVATSLQTCLAALRRATSGIQLQEDHLQSLKALEKSMKTNIESQKHDTVTMEEHLKRLIGELHPTSVVESRPDRSQTIPPNDHFYYIPTTGTAEELKAIASLGIAKKHIAGLKMQIHRAEAELDAASAHIAQLELGNQQLLHELASATRSRSDAIRRDKHVRVSDGETERPRGPSAVIVAQRGKGVRTPTASTSTTANSTHATESPDKTGAMEKHHGAVISTLSEDDVAVCNFASLTETKEERPRWYETSLRRYVNKITQPDVLELAFDKCRERGYFDDDQEVVLLHSENEKPRYDSLTGVEDGLADVKVTRKEKKKRAHAAEVFTKENDGSNRPHPVERR